MNAKALACTLIAFVSAAGFTFGFGPHASQSSACEKSSPLTKAKSSTYVREVYAVWYRVPPDSLARRRAGISELTAAHNRLPIGTLVRVTKLKNGKSVLVRITDRGITSKRAKIDICKEAAEQIDMVSEGIALVRIEIVPETPQASTAALRRIASPPAAPQTVPK
jgi:rare lipoprotein A (peptidoglycan hydrolase)